MSPEAKSLPVRTTTRLALLPPSHQVWVWPALVAALVAHCPHTSVEARVAVCLWALRVAGSLAWGSWLSCSLVGDPDLIPLYFSKPRFSHL